MMKIFSAPVFVSFGNHDYGQYRGEDEEYDPQLSEELHDALTAIKIPVLRNAAKAIEHPDGRLWIVGLDDLWYGDFKPGVAFTSVPGK